MAVTTDRRNFPTRGYLFLAETGIVFNRKADINLYNTEGNATDVSEAINGQPAFYRVIANFTKYYTLKQRYVLFYKLQAGVTLNSQGFAFDNFFMGGVQPLANRQMVFVGINEGQIITTSLSSLMAGLQYNVAGSLFLTARANTAVYNFSTQYDIYDSGEAKVINGFSLGLGYNLGVLPMEFNAMYSPEIGAFYSHVKIGFTF
jgi:outer membrane protein assembly factor BamA